jgi:uncharacterized phage-like protein YoqJ
VKSNKICTITGKSIFEMEYGLDEKYQKYIDFKLIIAQSLSRLIAERVTRFICSAEYGIPLWCAEILIGMQGFNSSQLLIVTPFENQAVKWTDEARERYYNVHAAADNVKFISRQYHEDCYRICEKVMVDKGDMLLTDNKGGFAAQYAEITGKPVISFEQLAMAFN